MFPGVVALTLAGVGLVSRRRIAPDGARAMLVCIAATGMILSLGPLTPVYEWAYQAVPPLRGLRVPSRFGILVLFAVAVLAGLGLSVLRQRTSSSWRTGVSIGLLLLATLESVHAPMDYNPIEWNPPIYRALSASEESGAVVELPIHPGPTLHLNARYLLASTAHWRPLVNGFGGFRPPGYDEIVDLVATFPSVVAVARMQALGVRHVVVHTSRYRRPDGIREALARLEGRPDLELVAQEGTDRLYRVKYAPSTRVGALLLTLPWPDLVFVDGPREGSVLRAWSGLEVVHGLQGPDQFLAYVEDTTLDSRLMLRLPVRMTGQFLDAATGEILGEVAVEAPLAAERPTSVVVPAGHQSVILHLRVSG